MRVIKVHCLYGHIKMGQKPVGLLVTAEGRRSSLTFVDRCLSGCVQCARNVRDELITGKAIRGNQLAYIKYKAKQRMFIIMENLIKNRWVVWVFVKPVIIIIIIIIKRICRAQDLPKSISALCQQRNIVNCSNVNFYILHLNRNVFSVVF